MGKTILVASGKGGTGKTMFSVNMGAVLARNGYRVMLLDMDMGLRNMDLYLGMENKVVYNIMDVLSGICKISKATIKVEGFDTLYFMAAAPKLDDRDITPLHIDVLCARLKEVFDYIIIDCPAGIDEMLYVSIPASERAVIVTEPEIAACRDADATERFLFENGLTDTCIVLNRVNFGLMKEGLLPDLYSIADMYQGPIVGMIQEDDNIRISTNRGVPIVCKKGTYIERNISDIVSRIISM